MESGASSPLYVHPTINDYPLEPVEFRLFCRIVGKAGWNNGFSRETIKQMAAACPKLSYRNAQYALRFLVAANLIEQILNTEGTKRIGWRPRKPKVWLAPEELPTIRDQIYSSRTAEEKHPDNVIPLPVVITVAGNGNAISVPRPELLIISDEMMTTIERDCPLVAGAVFSEKLRFFNYYKEPKRNKATSEFEPPLKTMQQWQDSFMKWMERGQQRQAEALERNGTNYGQAKAVNESRYGNGVGRASKASGKYSNQNGASSVSAFRKRTN